MRNFFLNRFPALEYPRYRRFWLGSFASVGATQLITLGQGWLIFELSGSPLQLGFLGAAAAVPNIVMTLIGGVIADRFDKRVTMMCTSASTALLLALLAWLDYSELVRVWHVLTVAAVFSLITGLDWPVRTSFFPLLVDRAGFMSAVALNSFNWQATRMAMPAAGGIVIALTDTWVIFALGSLGFAVMLFVVAGLTVQPGPPTRGSPLRQIVEGMHFVWTQDLFRWLLMLTFVGMFCASSYVQIMPVFANLLGSAETGYGYLLSSGGMGAVSGTLLIGGIHKYPRLGRIMLGSAGAVAIGNMLFALIAHTGWMLPALAMTFVTAMFASVFMISSSTVLQLAVPEELRGRVMGIHTIGFSLIPLGGLFLGALAESAGAPTAVLIGAGVYLLCVVSVATLARDVRELDGTILTDGVRA